MAVGKGFGRSRGLAPAGGGNLFVVDRTQAVVDNLVVASGAVALVAGTTAIAGFRDATGASAQFNSPVGAAVMPDGSFVVADAGNNCIRHVTASGVVTTLAGGPRATASSTRRVRPRPSTVHARSPRTPRGTST